MIARGQRVTDWLSSKVAYHGRMMSGALQSADVAIDAGVLQALFQCGTQQNISRRGPPSCSQRFRMESQNVYIGSLGWKRANAIGPTLR